MKQLAFFLVSIASLALVSCGQFSNREEIKQVEQLQDHLQAISLSIDSISTDDMNALHKTISSNVDYLYANYPRTDTMNRKNAILSSDYDRLRRLINKVNSGKGKLDKELDVRSKQLEDLITDLKNNKVRGGKEKFPEYYEQEKSALEKLEESSRSTNRSYRIAMRKFDLWSPPMESFLDSLKQSVARSNKL